MNNQGSPFLSRLFYPKKEEEEDVVFVVKFANRAILNTKTLENLCCGVALSACAVHDP